MTDKTIVFEVLGKPQGKARPRVNTFTKRAYTPKKTQDYEELIKWSFKNKYKNFTPLEGELEATIYAIFEVPKSYSKKKKAEVLTKKFTYTHKPDTDNIAKIILDSLNGIAYKDDSQIVQLKVCKLYGEQEKVVVGLDYFFK